MSKLDSAMSDERAVLLANLLGEYMVDSRGQSVHPREVANLTVAEVVTDIVCSTPTHMQEAIASDARALLNDPTPALFLLRSSDGGKPS